MLLELNNAQRQSTTPDLSSILTTWRERLPNSWEDLPAWNDLVSWRIHMFSHINNFMGRVEGRGFAASIGSQEMLWTVTRFAHVARRQMLPEACINIIAKIQSVNANLPQVRLGHQWDCYIQIISCQICGVDNCVSSYLQPVLSHLEHMLCTSAILKLSERLSAVSITAYQHCAVTLYLLSSSLHDVAGLAVMP